jgi:hypothetical protein
MNTIAYVYKWTNTKTNKWYVGSRTKQGCYPGDGYICSSKIVKPMILNNPLEWVQEILFTGDPKNAIARESEILNELNAKINPMSYNMHNGDGKFSTAGIQLTDEWKEKISSSNRGKQRTETHRENYKKANAAKLSDPLYVEKLKKPKHPGHGKKVSAATKGKKKSLEHRLALSKSKKGKKTGPCSEVRREAIRASLKGKSTLPLVVCPHCGLQGRSNMKRWHFDNCKAKN